MSVGLAFENDWQLGNDTLTDREKATVKGTALQTLRHAFQGFRVVVSEGRGADRLIVVDTDRVPFGPRGQPNPVGETYAFAITSAVHFDPLYHTLLVVVGCAEIAGCNKKTREEMVEGLGRGIGASAAHELGHQLGFRFALDAPCDDCYDSPTSNTYEHFFRTKHWSIEALANMRRVLPSGGVASGFSGVASGFSRTS